MIRQIRFLFLSLSIISAYTATSQSVFVPLNDDYYHWVDRLELKRGKFSKGFFSNVKPFLRKSIVNLADTAWADSTVSWTTADEANLRFLRDDSREWAEDSSREQNLLTPPSARRWFFKYPADFYSVKNENLDFHLNFATNNFVASENGRLSWYTARGVELRGMIDEKLGFYTFVSDNQGLFPGYVRNYATRYHFPAEGYIKKLGETGVDFISARGYIVFKPVKSINIQFGQDRNFFGSGYRSLFLSDAASTMPFLKIETTLGRFKYTNLWASMINLENASPYDGIRKKKYLAVHHLSLNVSDCLNIGFFEAEVFSRDSLGAGFDLGYLNPVIFYRYVESYLGSGDNALLGFDFRWIPTRNALLYGQLMLDEFLSSRYFNGKKAWSNKYAIQLGAKYVDVFGAENLDMQLEWNFARPYTYSHETGGTSYVHYNQPLAHPSGANFNELLGIIRYQPIPKLNFYGTVMFTRQGLDPLRKNWGANILLDYETREQDEGVRAGQGVSSRTTLLDLRASYMPWHNVFIDARLMRRQFSKASTQVSNYPETSGITLYSLGLRFNIPYRSQIF